MTPNLIINLDIEPITLMWNGQAISLPGTYELVPDEMVKHLHRRVMAIALHERKRIPFCGRLVGQAKSGKVGKQPPDLTAGEFNRREC